MSLPVRADLLHVEGALQDTLDKYHDSHVYLSASAEVYARKNIASRKRVWKSRVFVVTSSMVFLFGKLPFLHMKKSFSLDHILEVTSFSTFSTDGEELLITFSEGKRLVLRSRYRATILDVLSERYFAYVGRPLCKKLSADSVSEKSDADVHDSGDHLAGNASDVKLLLSHNEPRMIESRFTGDLGDDNSVDDDDDDENGDEEDGDEVDDIDDDDEGSDIEVDATSGLYVTSHSDHNRSSQMYVGQRKVDSSLLKKSSDIKAFKTTSSANEKRRKSKARKAQREFDKLMQTGDEHLLSSVIESDSPFGTLRTILQRRKGSQFSSRLQIFQKTSQSRIESLCKLNFEEFVKAVSHLRGARSLVNTLRSRIQDVELRVTSVSHRIVDLSRSLQQFHRVRKNLRSVFNVLLEMQSIALHCQRCEELLGNTTRLEDQHSTVNSRPSSSSRKRDNRKSTPLGAQGISSDGSDSSTFRFSLDSRSSDRKFSPLRSEDRSGLDTFRQLTKFYRVIQIIRQVEIKVDSFRSTLFGKFITSRFEPIRMRIKHSVTLLFNSWIEKIRNRLEDIGKIAVTRVRNRIEDIAHRRTGQRPLGNDRSDLSSPAITFSSPSSSYAELNHSLDSPTPSRTRSPTVLHGLSQVQHLANPTSSVLSELNIDMSLLYTSAHVYDSLGLKSEFNAYYASCRSSQLEKILHSSAIRGKKEIAGDDMKDQLIEETNCVLHKITGHFVVEHSVLRSGSDVLSSVELGTSWESIVRKLREFLLSRLEMISSPSTFLQLKDLFVRFAYCLQHYDYNITSLLEVIEDSRFRFVSVLLSEVEMETKKAFESVRCEPLIISGADELDMIINRLGLTREDVLLSEEQRGANNQVLQLRFSGFVVAVHEIICKFIDSFARFAVHLPDPWEANRRGVLQCFLRVNGVLRSALEDVHRCTWLQTAQIGTDAEILSVSVPSIAAILSKGSGMLSLGAASSTLDRLSTSDIRGSKQEGFLFSDALEAFAATRSSAFSLFTSKILEKLASFLSRADEMSWTATIDRDEPHDFMQDIVRFLQSVQFSTPNIPNSLRIHTLSRCFDSIIETILTPVSSRELKHISLASLHNLRQDLSLLEFLVSGIREQVSDAGTSLLLFCTFLDLVTSSAVSNNNSKRQVDKSSSFSGSGLRDLPLDSDRTLEYISEMQALMMDFAPKEKSHWKYICEEFAKRIQFASFSPAYTLELIDRIF